MKFHFLLTIIINKLHGQISTLSLNHGAKRARSASILLSWIHNRTKLMYKHQIDEYISRFIQVWFGADETTSNRISIYDKVIVQQWRRQNFITVKKWSKFIFVLLKAINDFHRIIFVIIHWEIKALFFVKCSIMFFAWTE